MLCLSKRTEYNGQLSSWTIQQLDELDRIFSKAYRKLSSNIASFPTDLLYLSEEHGGLGYHRTSDGIQTAKISMLQRHLKAGGYIAETMDTLLFNASVLYAQTITSGAGVTLHPPTSLMVDCWAHSLLRYAAEGDIKLSKQGSLSSPLPNTNIPHHQGGEQLSREWQQQRQICCIGDLYSLSSEGKSSWHDFSLTKGASLRQWQAGEPPDEPIPLRPLQQWLPSADSIYSSNTLVEILGWSEDNLDLINVRTFTSTNSDPIRMTSTIRNSNPLSTTGRSLFYDYLPSASTGELSSTDIFSSYS